VGMGILPVLQRQVTPRSARGCPTNLRPEQAGFTTKKVLPYTENCGSFVVENPFETE